MSEKFWLIALAIWVVPILVLWLDPESWRGALAGLLPILFTGFWTVLCWAVIIAVLIARHL